MDINDFKNEFGKNLKETLEMIQILGHDCHSLYLAIQNEDDQLHRRAYVRSVLAFIEGVSHRMKITALHLGVSLGNISIYELVALEGTSLDVDRNGDLSVRPLYLKFLNNIKFSFKMYSKAFESSFVLDTSRRGWDSIQKAVKVRDRLMHPKEVIQLQVAKWEIEVTKKAFDWFLINHNLCVNYAQKAVREKISPNLESIAELETNITLLEAELLKRGG